MVARDYYTLIYQTVKQIPRGKVAAYAEIANLCGLTGQARQVGYALHRLPAGLKVPWQRVVNAQGKISFPKGNANYKRQKKLLEQEGVRFINGAIDMKVYGWMTRLERKFR